MYRTLRLVHQAAAFALLGFIVMYFATGTVLTHEGLFGEPVYQERRYERPVTPPAGGDPGAAARALGAELGLPPRVRDARFGDDGSFGARFDGVRGTWQVNVAAGASTASVHERRGDWRAVLIRLHRNHSYAGGPVRAVWAAFHDLAALAMIVFAATGVLLWWKLEKRKWPGFVVLGLSTVLFVYTLGVLWT